MKAGLESLENAAAWLNDAELLRKHGSKSHARALLVIAGEEIGKASTCLLAAHGTLPFNHPEVDFRGNSSVFRSHRLKNDAVLGLIYSIINEEEFEKSSSTLLKQNLDKKHYRNLGFGKAATRMRTRWMYVDIEQEKNEIRILSPLESDSGNPEEVATILVRVISTLREMIESGFFESEEYERYKVAMQEMYHDFPKSPEWE